jgi:hypothetical protein
MTVAKEAIAAMAAIAAKAAKVKARTIMLTLEKAAGIPRAPKVKDTHQRRVKAPHQPSLLCQGLLRQ